MHKEPVLEEDEEGIADRALGAYLGFAIGDALGATVEFLTPCGDRRRVRRALAHDRRRLAQAQTRTGDG